MNPDLLFRDSTDDDFNKPQLKAINVVANAETNPNKEQALEDLAKEVKFLKFENLYNMCVGCDIFKEKNSGRYGHQTRTLPVQAPSLREQCLS